MKVLQGLPGPDNKNLGCVESGVQLEGWRGRFAGDASPKADNKLSCLGETRKNATRRAARLLRTSAGPRFWLKTRPPSAPPDHSSHLVLPHNLLPKSRPTCLLWSTPSLAPIISVWTPPPPLRPHPKPIDARRTVPLRAHGGLHPRVLAQTVILKASLMMRSLAHVVLSVARRAHGRIFPASSM